MFTLCHSFSQASLGPLEGNDLIIILCPFMELFTLKKLFIYIRK